MCAAKKAAKREKETGLVSKVEDYTGNTNPLPEHEVGPRLLVRLQAEKVIKKLKLPEKTLTAYGWSFDEVCALVASALGEEFLMPGEASVIERIRAEHPAETIAMIEAKASPPLVDTSGGVVTVKQEAFEGLLILGLGTSFIPLGPRGGRTERGWLADELAELLGVDAANVDVRGFDRARTNVGRRYSEHNANQEKRGLSVPRLQKLSEINQPSFELIRSYLAMEASKAAVLPQGKGPSPEASLALIRVGIRPPKSLDTRSGK